MKRDAMTHPGKPEVYIRFCDTYDRRRLTEIIGQGMETLGYVPKGKVYVKPNVVFAYNTKEFGSHAFTQPEFVGASLLALSRCKDVKRVDMGENSAMGFPTRLCYKHAGYYDQLKEIRKEVIHPVGMFCIDEEPRDKVFVGGTVHDTLRLPKKMARADSAVYLPKLKSHCVSQMTGAVKLNIGICSDDERAIRHDFLLNEKIVDLLNPGYPDFIVMDAIDVGVGNEAFPSPRKLGLVIMGTNPLAVDMVGARLIGLSHEDVPYLKAAVARGFTPASIDEVTLSGDITSWVDLDARAAMLFPYDEEFHRWQDVSTELARMNSPMRFMWGPCRSGHHNHCKTGCVMGLKMFLSAMEKFNGSNAFATAKPVVFVIGDYETPIDARGHEVFMLGSCSRAIVTRAKKITSIDKCFTTAADMNLSIGHKLGMKSLTRDAGFMRDFITALFQASFNKLISGRYIQDIWHFITYGLLKRI